MLQSTERGVGGQWSNTIVKEFLQEEIRVRLSRRNLYNLTSAQQIYLLFGRKVATIPNDGTCRVGKPGYIPDLRSDAPREDSALRAPGDIFCAFEVSTPHAFYPIDLHPKYTQVVTKSSDDLLRLTPADDFNDSDQV